MDGHTHTYTHTHEHKVMAISFVRARMSGVTGTMDAPLRGLLEHTHTHIKREERSEELLTAGFLNFSVPSSNKDLSSDSNERSIRGRMKALVGVADKRSSSTQGLSDGKIYVSVCMCVGERERDGGLQRERWHVKIGKL